MVRLRLLQTQGVKLQPIPSWNRAGTLAHEHDAWCASDYSKHKRLGYTHFYFGDSKGKADSLRVTNLSNFGMDCRQTSATNVISFLYLGHNFVS